MKNKFLFLFLLGLFIYIVLSFVQAKIVYWNVSNKEVQYAQTGSYAALYDDEIDRTSNTITTDNKDGTYTKYIYSLPRFYKLNDIWRDVDYTTTTPEQWFFIKPLQANSFPFFFVDKALADSILFSPSGAVDGFCEDITDNEAYITKHNSSTGDNCYDSLTTLQLRILSGTASNWARLRRSYIEFDIFSVSTTTIISANLLLYTDPTDNSVENNLELDTSVVIVEVNTAATTSLTAADWNITNFVTSTEFSIRTLFTTFATGTTTTIPLNANAIAYLQDNTLASFGILFDFDADSSEPSRNGNSNNTQLIWDSAEGGNPPTLVIGYSTVTSTAAVATTTFLTGTELIQVQVYFILDFLFFLLVLSLVILVFNRLLF